MSKLAIFEKSQSFGSNLAARGHHVVYRANETNRCPGCGRANWYVGRVTAECNFCGTAIALADANLWADGKVERSKYYSAAATEAEWEERRQHRRIKAVGRTLQLLVDGSPHSFALQNLSAGGAMGRDPIGLSPGTALDVQFEGGITVPAVVKWVEGEFVGVAFCDPGEAETRSL
ncbi:MAG TPA: PilZ domain-containing protein [Allosphingosinicella sp.]|nr:PilZ domain-containing protein [Allosphingosinicella sp.]